MAPGATTFDGDPTRLSLFLRQVTNHLNCYAHLYSSQWAMVEAVTAALEGKSVDWIADL